MRWCLLLMVLLLGCGRPVLIVPLEDAPVVESDPRRLWQEETDAPSLYRVYQRFFEPWWL